MELGQQGVFLRPKVGNTHLTNPENHESRSIRRLENGIGHPLIQIRPEYMYGLSGIDGLMDYH